MADLTLSDGRDITFDLSAYTVREYRSLFNRDQAAEEGDEIVGRAAGLTVDEVGSLAHVDYKRLLTAFFKRASEPLADPN